MTEFNTAHNRRLATLPIDDAAPLSATRKRSRSSHSVSFSTEDEIINPGNWLIINYMKLRMYLFIYCFIHFFLIYGRNKLKNRIYVTTSVKNYLRGPCIANFMLGKNIILLFKRLVFLEFIDSLSYSPIHSLLLIYRGCWSNCWSVQESHFDRDHHTK